MEFIEVLEKRKSTRNFVNESISVDEVSKLIQITHAAPSAGGLHPLSVYFVVLNVEKLDRGVYFYSPEYRTTQPILLMDIQEKLFEAGLKQRAIRAPVVFVISVDYE